MHPAFSVIFFTTLSGAGFGLWFWLGIRIAFGRASEMYEGMGWALGLIAGAILVAIGLFASFWHLGKPMRAWRAFSQWRTSWLSREGVLALASFVPAATYLFFGAKDPMIGRASAAALAGLAAATVYCTAMIYASLKTIPAWRHHLVLPIYALLSCLTGGLLCMLYLALSASQIKFCALALTLGAVVLWWFKHRYWRDIDREPLPLTTGDAIGLPGRTVSSFERPHTEANYITREMGFVLARKHSRKLRRIAVALFAWVPALCLSFVWLFPNQAYGAPIALAALSALLGAMVERWLFFAEAKHLVTLYY